MKTIKTITIEQAFKKHNDRKNQELKGKFVGQHVYCNVNSLAEYVISKGFKDSNAPFSLDDVENYYSYPEWSITLLGEDLYFNGGSASDKETFLEEFERLENESSDLFDNEEISETTHERNKELIAEAKEQFENIDTEAAEIFEWWAVSSYLYDKLKENGECVVDAGSCFIWGRTTTGQAILLDAVIGLICADMEILEGQANSWAKK